MDIPENLIPGELELTTVNGNAFAVMGAVRRALIKAGNDSEVADAVIDEMMSGDYDHLLQVAIAVTELPED